MRGELDAILLRALQRDPARRYANAEAMQADLQRYLDGVAVSARAPSLGQRAGLWMRRLARAFGLGRRRRSPRTPGWFDIAEHAVTPAPAVGGRRRPAFAVALALLGVRLAGVGVWQLGLRTVDARPAAAAPKANDDNAEARELFLRSRFELSTRTPNGLQAAQQGFRGLIDLYPQRAPA